MKFYAVVLWRTRGTIPRMLQLIYLGNGEIMRYAPDEADLLATERKINALWQAIDRARLSGDWRPRQSRLCDWCSFQALCPVYGGTPPPLPSRSCPVPPRTLTYHFWSTSKDRGSHLVAARVAFTVSSSKTY